jgi:lysozyme family protein
MANFEKIFPRVLFNEGADTSTGGYQKWHDDNGNWTGGKVGVGDLIGTKYGITAPELCTLLGRKANETDMKALSIENALKIYRVKYWNVIRGDEIESEELAYQIADEQVNAGGMGIKLAHRIAGLPETTVMTDEVLNILNNKK